MIRFEFNGTGITNPFESECGRFEVSPEDYGFSRQDIELTALDDGERGRAWVKDLDSGEQIRLTTANGKDIPEDAGAAWIERVDPNPSHGIVERHPVPLAGTIAAYAEALLHLHGLDLDPEVQRLSVESGCGEECVKVLDAANGLVAVAADVADEVRAAVERQLAIFYFG
ncbi:MAG: hypothetical protein AzoDbin1_04015 [Azoarcus sp.]|nr:hypothetical protein [Azoarcus sp.]